MTKMICKILGVCALLMQSAHCFVVVLAPSVAKTIPPSMVRATARQSIIMVDTVPANPFLEAMQGIFGGLGTGGKGWRGIRGVRRAELKSQLAEAVELNQGRCVMLWERATLALLYLFSLLPSHSKMPRNDIFCIAANLPPRHVCPISFTSSLGKQ